MRSAHSAVRNAMRFLDDERGEVWTYDELMMYAKDGYDRLCRKTKCLFDMHNVPNVPPTGNWGTDLEKYMAQQMPGMGLTDDRLHFTERTERDAIINGVGGSTEGPTAGTSQRDTTHYDDFDIPTKVATARLPESVVDVVRVTWDQHELLPEGSREMRRLDSQYEQREGGDPQHFLLDKDGVQTIRFVPPAGGDAVYLTIEGVWGSWCGTDDPDVTVGGSWGILTEVEGAFAANGPWGTVTQQHPTEKALVVEVSRLGQSLPGHLFEVPDSYVKFVEFWTMHRALKRDGPGQDLKLSKHFADRFEMGTERMQTRLRRVHKERQIRMGSGGTTDEPFGLGEPQLPFSYGPGRRI